MPGQMRASPEEAQRFLDRLERDAARLAPRQPRAAPERTYSVEWERLDEPGVYHICDGLTIRVAFARLRAALRSGPILVRAIRALR